MPIGINDMTSHIREDATVTCCSVGCNHSVVEAVCVGVFLHKQDTRHSRQRVESPALGSDINCFDLRHVVLQRFHCKLLVLSVTIFYKCELLTRFGIAMHHALQYTDQTEIDSVRQVGSARLTYEWPAPGQVSRAAQRVLDTVCLTSSRSCMS